MDNIYTDRRAIIGKGDSWEEQDTGELKHRRWDKGSKSHGKAEGTTTHKIRQEMLTKWDKRSP